MTVAQNTRRKDPYETIKSHEQNFINTGERMSKMKNDFDELHQTMASINQKIEYLLRKSNETGSGSNGGNVDRAEGSENARARQETYTPPHLRNQSNQQNSISIAYKVDFPEFNGENPQKWIRKANRFFELNPNENRKVLHAGYYMIDTADTWYTEYVEGQPGIDWETFCEMLLQRFIAPGGKDISAGVSNEKKNEITTLNGFDGDHRLLVYEYMSLGSLENHLFDLEPDQKPLSWSTRMKIPVGAARGLEYLHYKANPHVIYSDLKSSNILLDNDFNVKLSDFGFARLGPIGDNTHVSTRVMGTYGYCAPEYAMSGKLTLKSDIYSFGVVVLELNTGRKAIDCNRNVTNEGSQNMSSYISHAHDSLLKRMLRGEKYLKVYIYHFLINGFAVLVTPQQADRISRRREVLNVVLDFTVRTETTHTPLFLGLSQGAWVQEGGLETAGEGIVIGLIDTRIDPTHQSFSDNNSPDKPYPIPKHFSGNCEITPDFPYGSCNRKLVGDSHFAASAITRGISNATQDYASPFDGDGHGTHTAAIAAGNHGVSVIVAGHDFGNASGMAPRSHIAVYKALSEGTFASHRNRTSVTPLAKFLKASETDHRAEVSASKKIADVKLAKDFQAVLREFQKTQRLAAERETAYAPFAPQAVLTSGHSADEIYGYADRYPELQAIIRGHLIRRQAVSTLHCMQAIVKLQALARSRQTSVKLVTVGTDAYFQLKKLAKNVFVRKFLVSLPTTAPLTLQYDLADPTLIYLGIFQQARVFTSKSGECAASLSNYIWDPGGGQSTDDQ